MQNLVKFHHELRLMQAIRMKIGANLGWCKSGAVMLPPNSGGAIIAKAQGPNNSRSECGCRMWLPRDNPCSPEYVLVMYPNVIPRRNLSGLDCLRTDQNSQGAESTRVAVPDMFQVGCASLTMDLHLIDDNVAT
jgi:hypothetical protein